MLIYKKFFLYKFHLSVIVSLSINHFILDCNVLENFHMVKIKKSYCFLKNILNLINYFFISIGLVYINVLNNISIGKTFP